MRLLDAIDTTPFDDLNTRLTAVPSPCRNKQSVDVMGLPSRLDVDKFYHSMCKFGLVESMTLWRDIRKGIIANVVYEEVS